MRLGAPLEDLVLRYEYLYGPGARSEMATRLPSVHVAGATRAAAAAVSRGRPGPYDVGDDGGEVSNELTQTELLWEPSTTA